MYKVLIIDDEQPLREAIQILGEWDRLQVGEVLEAADGQAGLDMLRACKPDLVMLDMQMPVMGGMELLKVIEQEYPQLPVIIISGYNDFEYTRQAIRSSALDYLLKPVDRQELNLALQKGIDQLEARKQTRSESISRNIAYNMSLPKLKEKLFLSLIEGSYNKNTDQASLSLIGAGDKGRYYGVLVLRVLNLQAVCQQRFNDDTELLSFAVANVFNEMTESGLTCFSFAHPKEEREMIAVYDGIGADAREWQFRAGQLLRSVVAQLHTLFGMVSVGGQGAPALDPGKLAESYEEARNSVYNVDLLKLSGRSVVGMAEDRRPMEIPSLTGRMALIKSSLENGNPHQAETLGRDYLRQIRTAAYFRMGDADRLLTELVVLCNDMAREFGIAAESMSSPGEKSIRALGLKTDFSSFDELEQVFTGILKYYGTLIMQAVCSPRPFDAQQMKDFIDHHYFEDIKISYFAEKYYLSREYLMKLFKQQFGYGIHEYVQKIRMEKALELLGNPALKVQEISEMLGYKDKNYFSKAFRNYYGTSPSEYRNQP